MRLADLPERYRDDRVKAWMDAWGHELYGYPLVDYYIVLPGKHIHISGSGEVDLRILEKAVRELAEKGVRTFGDLARYILSHGYRDTLLGAYLLPVEGVWLALDPPERGKLSFVFSRDEEAVSLDVDASVGVEELWRLFRYLEAHKKEVV